MMQDLETQGLQFTIQGQAIIYRGTLVGMLGDNAGSHQIGGCTENFSTSTHYCQFCEIKRKKIKFRYLSRLKITESCELY